MDPEAKRPGSLLTLLIGLVLFLTVAVVVVCWVPLVDCPDCDSEWQRYAAEFNARDKITHDPYCGRCRDKCRVTWLNRWVQGDGPLSEK